MFAKYYSKNARIDVVRSRGAHLGLISCQKERYRTSLACGGVETTTVRTAARSGPVLPVMNPTDFNCFILYSTFVDEPLAKSSPALGNSSDLVSIPL